MPRLGAVEISAINSDTLIYQAPASKRATVTVNFCNPTDSPALINLALTADAGLIQSTDWIEYKTNLPPGGSFERTSLAPADGQCIKVRSNVAGIVVVAWGYSE
jgi:hypothetical protein